MSYTINIHVPNSIQNIQDVRFCGEISYIDQEDNYIFQAPRTGVYRFDFVIADVESEYRFYVFKENNEVIKTVYSSSGGVTVELTGGETYKIKIRQYLGVVKYEINIGIPSEEVIVEGDSFDGVFAYTDQENWYKYIVPLSGEYTFSLGTNDVTTTYRMNIFSPSNEEILTVAVSSNREKTVYLEANQVYTIRVKQDIGFPTYQIYFNYTQ